MCGALSGTGSEAATLLASRLVKWGIQYANVQLPAPNASGVTTVTLKVACYLRKAVSCHARSSLSQDLQCDVSKEAALKWVEDGFYHGGGWADLNGAATTCINHPPDNYLKQKCVDAAGYDKFHSPGSLPIGGVRHQPKWRAPEAGRTVNDNTGCCGVSVSDVSYFTTAAHDACGAMVKLL